METNLIVLDIETTGLDPCKDLILEIAACSVKLDKNNISIGRKIHFYIKNDINKIYEIINVNALEMHNSNNLLNDLEDPINFSNTFAVDDINFPLYSLIDEGKSYYLCGNSIHFDKAFLKYHIPEFEKRLSYRILDLTSYLIMKSIFVPYENKRKSNHRALDDLNKSIELLSEQHILFRNNSIFF